MAKYFFLEDYRILCYRLGRSNAQSVLRQVKKLDPNAEYHEGQKIDMGGFVLEVFDIDDKRIHVMMDHIKS